jgi:NAD(P)-dependent dehydrogenase (short-subunit alcohol dehydrogenase family)
MSRIDGQTALVTGAAGGIGLGIAEALLAAGASVVISDLDGDEVSRQAQRLGPDAHGVVLDVTDAAAWERARLSAEDWRGPVDILISNAGVGPELLPLVDSTPEGFAILLRTKLDGTFLGVRTLAGGMRERRRGHVVTTASMAGLTVMPRLGAYTTAMFGVVGMTEVLAAELAPFDVGVSVLCPGRVRSRLAETTRAITGGTRQNAGPSEGSPTSLSQTVLESRAVGDLVVAGIRSDALHIITHGEYREAVEERHRRIVDAFERAPRHDGAGR